MEIKNILIVDDSGTSRMIAKRCIEIAGFQDVEFSEAENGLEALDIVKSTRIDLIVTDLNMPKMDGNTFLQQLIKLENKKRIPVIVLSSSSDSGSLSTIDQINYLGIIKKPVSPPKILDILGAYADDNQGF